MGYVPTRKVYKLVFADPDMDGLEVRARSVPLGQFLDLTTLSEAAQGSDSEATEATRNLLTGFAEQLVSWNIEDEDGTPVPADLDGLRRQDTGFALSIIFAWLDAVGDVAAPLEGRSPGGGPSLVASIPMEPLSSSRAS